MLTQIRDTLYAGQAVDLFDGGLVLVNQLRPVAIPSNASLSEIVRYYADLPGPVVAALLDAERRLAETEAALEEAVDERDALQERIDGMADGLADVKKLIDGLVNKAAE